MDSVNRVNFAARGRPGPPWAVPGAIELAPARDCAILPYGDNEGRQSHA